MSFHVVFGITLSAVLLFGKEETIHSIVPHYKIDALLRREDTNRYDDRDNIRCNLIESFDRLMAFVEKHLPDKFHMQGIQRISLRDKIFRETIVNMLIHREYTNAFPSTFIIYKDRVVTQNANKPKRFGKLEPGNYTPFPKNPDIANIFTQMGHSEELGTGIYNVYKYTKSYSGSDNITFNEEDVFVSEIPLKKLINKNNDPVNDTVNVPLNDTVNNTNNPANNTNDPVNDPVNVPINVPLSVPLNDRQKSIISTLNKFSNITQFELADMFNVNKETIKRDLSKLQKIGIIKRIGSRKTGYWKIIKKIKND